MTRAMTIQADEADADLGPYMKALMPRHRLFVHYMFELGDSNASNAARAAGYADNRTGSIGVLAHRLIHRTDVQEALGEEAKRRMKALLPLAIKRVTDEAENPQSRQGLKAASMIMNRGGLPETTSRIVEHKVTLTDVEKVAEIRSMAMLLGLDPEKLLGTVTDAEFTDVTGLEGLEDLL